MLSMGSIDVLRRILPDRPARRPVVGACIPLPRTHDLPARLASPGSGAAGRDPPGHTRTMTCRCLLVRGRVQGVGYRASLRAEALRLGLTGWVRNREDGTVEALVVGSGPAVDALVAWARTGPRFARVSTVDLREATPAEVESAGAGFRIVG